MGGDGILLYSESTIARPDAVNASIRKKTRSGRPGFLFNETAI
jgi:hypothetical protein